MWEILAVKNVLLSLRDKFSELTVKWFTDNQNVPRIVSSCSRGISIEMEWIQRIQNDKAAFLSHNCNTDDWGFSRNTFQNSDLVWGSYSIDRFANYLNTKLPRVNSRF